MEEGPDIARLAALIGEPARANMLVALMSGEALTVSELASEVGLTLQTASWHLKQLGEAELLRVHKQGRHKYFSLFSDQVAHVLEGLMGLAASTGHNRTRRGPLDAALRKARVCYNHLAGEMGTRLFGNLVNNRLLWKNENSLDVTEEGYAFVRSFGIDIDTLKSRKAPLCRECLDWSERRSHLAGSLGRAFLTRLEELDWARRDEKTRVVTFTDDGEREFTVTFSRTHQRPRFDE